MREEPSERTGDARENIGWNPGLISRRMFLRTVRVDKPKATSRSTQEWSWSTAGHWLWPREGVSKADWYRQSNKDNSTEYASEKKNQYGEHSFDKFLR